MNIQEAARITSEKGTQMYRESDKRYFFIPTNTDACCIVCRKQPDGSLTHRKGRWNPMLEDLTADDWRA